MNFQHKLEKIMKKNNSLLCVGLDSALEKIPERFKRFLNPQFEFNKWIIDETHEFVCAYKPNSAFYEGVGADGVIALKQTCDYIRFKYPDISLILDFKRGDIGSTNEGYVDFAFNYLGVDAVTLHPYLGKGSLEPFLKHHEKGLFILCKTSNPGSGELQNLKVEGMPFYQYIAREVSWKWNEFGNCMLVVGATYPAELEDVRKIVGDMTILVPGIGSQGGDIEKTVEAGINSKKTGMIISSSRSIIFADDPRKEAKKLRDEINNYRR